MVLFLWAGPAVTTQDEGKDDFWRIFLEYNNYFVPLRKICVFLTTNHLEFRLQ